MQFSVLEEERAAETGALLGEEVTTSRPWASRKAVAAVGLVVFAAGFLCARSTTQAKEISPDGKSAFMQAQAYGGQAYGAQAGYGGAQAYGAPAYGAPAYGGQQYAPQPAYGGQQYAPQGYGAGAGQGQYGMAQAAHPEGFVPFAQAQAQAQAVQAPPPPVPAAAAPVQAPVPAVAAPPGVAAPPAAEPAAPPPAAEQPECSWEGENCVHSKCCKRAGLTCWEKMADAWGSCSNSCEELKGLGGEEWTCAALGPAGAPKMAQPSSVAAVSVSLFCFTVVTAQGICPPGVKEGWEQQVLDKVQAAQLSLFACEGSAVYQGARAETGEWKSIKNTDIFVDVWRKVQGDAQWEQHDWTVKVDVDAVFFPDRLKMHIQGSKPDPSQPIYYHNIDFKFKFMGALEVMNKEAVKLLLKDLDLCKEHIGNNGGEDIFTMSCLDAIGAFYMEDYSLVDDKYSVPANFNLFDVDHCENDAIVAFHPYKAINSWMGCHKVATGEVSKTQFTSCVHRWEGEACSLSGTLDHPGEHMDPGTGIVG